MTHELKCISPYFEAVQIGDKKFEIRKDDRCFQKGDKVILRHYDQEHCCYVPDSVEIYLTITYVCHFEQKEGWCVFGFEKEKGV